MATRANAPTRIPGARGGPWGGARRGHGAARGGDRDVRKSRGSCERPRRRAVGRATPRGDGIERSRAWGRGGGGPGRGDALIGRNSPAARRYSSRDARERVKVRHLAEQSTGRPVRGALGNARGVCRRTPGRTGTGALVEHVTFLGSRKRDQWLGSGTRGNAYTDFHHTVFHIHAPTTNKDGHYMPPNVFDILNDVAFTRSFWTREWRKRRKPCSRRLR